MTIPTSAEREKLKQKLGLTDADFVKPAPQRQPWSRPFWDAAPARVGWCARPAWTAATSTTRRTFYCTACGSRTAPSERPARGTATLLAYAVNAYGVPAAFMEDLPYVLAVVLLPEGPRMISNVVDCDPQSLRNGMALEVVFREAAPGVVLPKWRPARGGPNGAV